jgi:hypothetical protein
MSKKVWISLPLITSTAFITKWLMDKGVPFSIDFESSTLDRNLVLEGLPRRLQKVLGYKISAAGEAGVDGGQTEAVEAGATAPVVTDVDHMPEPAAESPFGDAGDEAAEMENGGGAEDTQIEN